MIPFCDSYFSIFLHYLYVFMIDNFCLGTIKSESFLCTAANVIDENTYVHMFSILNIANINNIIFYLSHELWRVVRRKD